MIKKFIVLLAGIFMMVPLAAAAGKPQGGEVREFKMTAKKYQFDPGVITVKQGEKVRLVITATDRDHRGRGRQGHRHLLRHRQWRGR